MENAIKALTMAAGVIIAILLISLIVITFVRITNIQDVDIKQEEARQLAEFNQQYTKYQNQYIYGTEFVTIVNKALDNGITVVKNGTIITTSIDKTSASAYIDKKYQCTNIQYNNGKVNRITFREL